MDRRLFLDLSLRRSECDSATADRRCAVDAPSVRPRLRRSLLTHSDAIVSRDQSRKKTYTQGARRATQAPIHLEFGEGSPRSPASCHLMAMVEGM
jgi:hypothetical protein